MTEPTCWALVLAAGQGSRLAAATGGTAKQFLRWHNAPLWWSAAKALAGSPRVQGLVFVFPPDNLETATQELAELDRAHSLGTAVKVAAGGARRQDSVRLGLSALPPECTIVLVHDSARPFVSTALVSRVTEPLFQESEAPIMGVVPGLTVTDTIKQVTAEGIVLNTLEREHLYTVQTPQVFFVAALRLAHERAEAEGWQVTDDASLMERNGHTVLVVEGEADNKKITTPEDLPLLSEHPTQRACTGYGYDVHRFGGNRPLILGGVLIPGDWMVEAHSDGDVLLHALIDAILGCLGAGDIGRLFPDTDPRWDGISSALLLDEVSGMAAKAGLRITHADLTLIAQKPRLGPHANAIRRNVARLIGLDETWVNVKATTEEGLGFTGEGKGLKAVAVVSALR